MLRNESVYVLHRSSKALTMTLEETQLWTAGAFCCPTGSTGQAFFFFCGLQVLLGLGLRACKNTTHRKAENTRVPWKSGVIPLGNLCMSFNQKPYYSSKSKGLKNIETRNLWFDLVEVALAGLAEGDGYGAGSKESGWQMIRWVGGASRKMRKWRRGGPGWV